MYSLLVAFTLQIKHKLVYRWLSFQNANLPGIHLISHLFTQTSPHFHRFVRTEGRSRDDFSPELRFREKLRRSRFATK